MMADRLRPTYRFAEDRIDQLKQLVPEAFADGRIRWEVLRESLGEKADYEGEEKYGLFWPGKREARQLASTSSSGTLVPVTEEGQNTRKTPNIFVEGENLEVLKLLHKSYAGRFKMIYIDPPYNTGNDLVYSDDYTEPLTAYLERTGQIGELGELLTTNQKSSGRFHSRWLSMLYPRLIVARSLLAEDGVILISIDDNEVDRLKLLCCEVFGEENFVAIFTWETKRAARGVPPNNLLMSNHEYILCFGYDASNVRFRGLDRDEEDFSNPDADERGLWRSESIRATGAQDNYFTIVDPETGNEFHGNWAFSEQTIEEMIEKDLILFPSEADGTPRQKKFIDAYRYDTKAGVTALGWHSTERSTKELMDLFDGKKVFDFPKPLSLIRYLCDQILGPNDMVLDFFAGSCTTAHAVMIQNLEDGGSRSFFMIQLPEPVEKGSAADDMGLGTVCDIGRERIRRAATRLASEFLDEQEIEDGLLGYRAFKLAKSNFAEWRDYEGENVGEYQMMLSQATDSPLVSDWKEEDLLVEVILNQGFPLDSEVNRIDWSGNTLHVVGHELHDFKLYICLDETVTTETAAQAMNLDSADVLVCMDSSLTDEVKMRLEDSTNLLVI